MEKAVHFWYFCLGNMKLLESIICYSQFWEAFLKAYDKEVPVILKAEPQGIASLHFVTISIIKKKKKQNNTKTLKKGQEW